MEQEGEEREDPRSPLRTCTGCRARRAKDEMLRFVLGPQGELVFDANGKLPGRGAHTCADPTCVRRAVERRGFDRSFRRQVQAGGAEALLERIRTWLLTRILNLLGLARRSGRLLAGGDEVERAIDRGEAKLLVLAADLSARRLDEMNERASVREVPVLRVGTMESLGRAVGRPPTGILGVVEGPQLAPLLQAGARLEKFGGALPQASGPGTLGESRLEA